MDPEQLARSPLAELASTWLASKEKKKAKELPKKVEGSSRKKRKSIAEGPSGINKHLVEETNSPPRKAEKISPFGSIGGLVFRHHPFGSHSIKTSQVWEERNDWPPLPYQTLEGFWMDHAARLLRKELASVNPCDEILERNEAEIAWLKKDRDLTYSIWEKNKKVLYLSLEKSYKLEEDIKRK
ncbi:hypothetical protein J5N97_028383 [Dioscorea zingiberensis]|uniref:TFIIS central domain-containing protein n=1 Tax=Dioscorea zingiberensis TaxID=325984 RepID=A0A9D5BYG8_9LILI|nr:hypothetical protein J5N97_028383 [Dioscorea zingiberensis]